MKNSLVSTTDLIGLGVAIVITAGGYFVGVRPVFESRNERSELRSELDEANDRSFKAEATRSNLASRLSRVEEQIEASDVELGRAADINKTVARVGKLAEEIGLSVDKLLPSETVEGDAFALTTITVGGRGSFPSCERFLRELHDGFPDVRIDSVDLKSDGGAGQGDLAFSFGLVWMTGRAGASG